MNILTAHKILLPAATALIDDPRLKTNNSFALVHAIALQESDYKSRQQLIGHHRHWWESLKGPAVSLWQFEDIGILEVLRNRATRKQALHVLALFGYPEHLPTIREALKHNDLLAAAWARLALWRHRDPLPGPNDTEVAWRYYLQIWAPGKAKRKRWAERYALAWAVVLGEIDDTSAIALKF